MNDIILSAPAKINLFLDIIGCRNDGYHLIKSIFQTVTLSDIIKIHFNNTKNITVNTNNSNVPNNENNIAFKAAKLFFKKINETCCGVDIHIIKNIPSQAGLGGGSSDAATVIKGLNKLYNANLSITELEEISSKIGADVPFFIRGGTALVEGIGEIITPIQSNTKLNLVIAKGNDGISTPEAYKRFDNSNNLPRDGNLEKIQSSIFSNNINLLSKNVFNIFEYITDLPDVFNIKKIMYENGALCSLMSGSGSAVFGIFENQKIAKKCSNILKKEYFSTVCVENKPSQI